MDMRRTRTALVVLPLILLATACMKVDYHLTVDADGGGSLAVDIALAKAMAEMTGEEGEDFCGDMTGDMTGDFPTGGTIETYEDGDWCGVRMAAEVDDIAELLDMEDAGLGMGFPEIDREGDVMTFRMIPDLEDMGEDEMSPDEMAMFFEMMEIPEPEFVIRVTLPGAPVEHNADSVDGSTFTWNLNLMGGDSPSVLEASTEVSAPAASSSSTDVSAPAASSSSSDDGGSSTTVIIVVVVAVVLLAAVLVAKQRSGGGAGADQAAVASDEEE